MYLPVNGFGMLPVKLAWVFYSFEIQSKQKCGNKCDGAYAF